MEYTKRYIERSSKLSKFYSKYVYDDLKQLSTDIMNELKMYFDKYGDEYGLTSVIVHVSRVSEEVGALTKRL